MQRKEFIKRLGFGSLMVPLVVAAERVTTHTGHRHHDNDDHYHDGRHHFKPEPAPCRHPKPPVRSPTKTPADLVMVDIRSDRTGIEMVLNLTIQNSNKQLRRPGRRHRRHLALR